MQALYRSCRKFNGTVVYEFFCDVIAIGVSKKREEARKKCVFACIYQKIIKIDAALKLMVKR